MVIIEAIQDEAIQDQEQELQEMKDRSEYRSERDRATILLRLARSGLSQRGVARVTGHAYAHVNDTAARLRDGGLEALRERRGGSNRLPLRDEIMELTRQAGTASSTSLALMTQTPATSSPPTGQQEQRPLRPAAGVLLVALPKGTIHLILDNYIIHKSNKTQAFLAKLGGRIKLHLLPPYSPKHNSIERVGWDVHEHITRSHRHPNIEKLMAAVRAYLKRYPELGAHAASLTRQAA